MIAELTSEPIQELLKLTKGDISVIAKDKIYLIAETDPRMLTGDRVMIIVNAEVTKPGQTIIDRKVLANIPKKGALIIDKNNIRCGTRNIKFKENSLTLAPMNIGEKFLDIPKTEFEKVLDVEYAISQEPTRPILQGVFINQDSIVALDGYRLALRNHSIESNLDSFEVVIPGELIKLYKKIKSEENIKVYVKDNFITLEVGGIQISFRQIEGKYINYKSLLPNDHKLEVKVESQELLKLLQSYKDINLIKFKFKSDEIAIEASNEIMTIEDKFKCKMKGEPMKIAFNPKYLIDTLKHYKDAIMFEFMNPVSPLVIRDFEKYDLILPVRISVSEENK